MPGDSVKVAVRVRPFNQREKAANCKCIVSMKGSATTLTNPENKKTHTFSFDNSYWSHDGFEENEDGVYIPINHHYADQRQVFDDLGQGVLDNAWQGYNAALFAYGQTGAGKSYSMIGYGANRGIVPITCDELFKAIKDNDDKEKQLQVTFSMLEIYNEQVRDLLVKPSKGAIQTLKIRLNPQTGFFVDGLKSVPVKDYDQIEHLMDQGTLHRTTASTNMNATSSRSHMVITIKFKQVYNNDMGENTTKSSEINLVDLAGSERAKATGATGDRLKEGSAINVSLSMLGNVISALADQAMGKNVKVPYRNSVLTKLLQNALGGNSKTIMIAALSPADINFAETLSTLRYADRAKKIQNKAVVNESPTERLIRELREENAKLLKMIKSGKMNGSSSNDLQSLLQSNERQMEEMDKTWDQRLQEAREEWERSQIQSVSNEAVVLQKCPYIQNVNEDAQLCGIIKHSLPKGEILIGKGGEIHHDGHKIELRGLGIQLRHAVFRNKGRDVTLTKVGDSRTFVNGNAVAIETQLKHQDRIIVGSNSLFLYIGFPDERTSSSTPTDKYSYDFFQSELAEKQGLMGPNTGMSGLQDNERAVSPTNALLSLVYQDLSSILPIVEVVNAISKEMNRNIVCEPFIKNLATHDAQGRDKPKEVNVLVTDTDTNQVWVWSKDKFSNRRFLVEALYGKFQENPEGALQIEKLDDPFWDPVEDIHVGCAHVWLINLAYLMEIDDDFEIQNDRGKSEGILTVKILPCDPSGRVLGDGSMTLEPTDIIDDRLDFIIVIQKCNNIKWIQEENRRGVFCRFDFFDYPKPFKTKTIWHKPSAQVGFRKQITINKVTDEFLLYLQTHALVIDLWGTQVDSDLHGQEAEQGNSLVDVPTILLSDENETLQPGTEILASEQFELAQLREDLRKQSLLNETLMKENALMKEANTGLRRSLDASAGGATRRSSDLDHGVRSVRKEEDLKKRYSTGNFNVDDLERQFQSQLLPPPVPREAFSKTTSDVAEFGKILKSFFQDIKPVRKHLKTLRQSYEHVDSNNLESLNDLIDYQREELASLEANLTSCLTSLRTDVGAIIRDKRRSSQPTQSSLQ